MEHKYTKTEVDLNKMSLTCDEISNMVMTQARKKGLKTSEEFYALHLVLLSSFIAMMSNGDDEIKEALVQNSSECVASLVDSLDLDSNTIH